MDLAKDSTTGSLFGVGEGSGPSASVADLSPDSENTSRVIRRHRRGGVDAHPQLYVDVGVIVYTQPRAAFYGYLKALVDAGFANQIMFGSDRMSRPQAIARPIEIIEQAPFLSAPQKRNIFYNNAARFLRLDAKTIARHHAL